MHPLPVARRDVTEKEPLSRYTADCETGSSPGSVHHLPAPSRESSPQWHFCRFAPLTVAGPRRLIRLLYSAYAHRRCTCFLWWM